MCDEKFLDFDTLHKKDAALSHIKKKERNANARSDDESVSAR